MADRMISQVKLYYEQINKKFQELGTVTLNLEIDPQIEIVLAQGFDIGRVKCRKESDRFPISTMEKPLKECQIQLLDVGKLIGQNGKTPDFRGVTYLQGDQVMLADNNNNRVILLNSSYQYIASFTLPEESWDVCLTDHQEVCVSLPRQKTLQFLRITSGAIKPIRKVETIHECFGVASGNGKIAVSGRCYEGKCYWSLIESTRKMCYSFECHRDLSNTYIAFNSSSTRVYLTVWKANSLYCFDMDGRMMYTYSPESLKYAHGVATDRDDNVYVVGRRSKNIHQLTSDGTPIRVITEGIPENSTAICFNSSLDRFLITNGSSSDSYSITVFRLK